MPLAHSQTIVQLKNVSFSYTDTPVLSDVSLAIHAGDYLGVVGPNGGGKTTLIKIILGLVQPQQGTVTIWGKAPNKLTNRSKIAYVAQKATQFDRNFPVTAREVVAMGRLPHHSLLHLNTQEDEKEIALALQQVGMTEQADSLIGSLSGGQQQRIFIARALAQKAELLFLDEPTAGVDAAAQDDFYALLRHLNQDLGLTLIIVTHEQDVVRKEVTEVACVNQHLNYHGSNSEFLQSKAFDKLYGAQVKHIHHHHD